MTNKIIINPELILQAHDQMHKGNYSEAHELLHQSLGANTVHELPAATIAHRFDFDQAFRTACRKNGVRAMYVLIDNTQPNGQTRLLSGGDGQLCTEIDKRIRSTTL